MRKYINDLLKTLRVECQSSSPHAVLSDMFRLLNWTNWAPLSNILNVRGIPLLILHTEGWYKVSWLMQYSTLSPLISESICLTAGFICGSQQRQSISNKMSRKNPLGFSLMCKVFQFTSGPEPIVQLMETLWTVVQWLQNMFHLRIIVPCVQQKSLYIISLLCDIFPKWVQVGFINKLKTKLMYVQGSRDKILFYLRNEFIKSGLADQSINTKKTSMKWKSHKVVGKKVRWEHIQDPTMQ